MFRNQLTAKGITSLIGNRSGNRKAHVAKWLAIAFARIAPNYFSQKIRDPIFIIGCNRSGTTLLVNTLATHPELATYPGEANDLWHPQTFPWRYSAHKSDLLPLEVNPLEFTERSLKHRSPSEEERLKAVFGAFQYFMRRDRFLNKSAMISFMIPYILEKFPSAKFIHIVRDGRGVARSWAQKMNTTIQNHIELYKGQGFGISYEDLLLNCAYSWRLHIQEVENQKHRLGLEKKGMLLELRYEDFCTRPDYHLFELASFMDVSPSAFQNGSYDHILNMNYKYMNQFKEPELKKLTQIMEPGLVRWGYI